nr:hypothetical protein [Pantoea stewartii]
MITYYSTKPVSEIREVPLVVIVPPILPRVGRFGCPTMMKVAAAISDTPSCSSTASRNTQKNNSPAEKVRYTFIEVRPV